MDPVSDSQAALEEFEKLLENRPSSVLVQVLRQHEQDGCELPNGFVSIFDKNRGTVATDRNTVLNILRGTEGGRDFREHKKLYEGAMGSMVGMALADAMGHRFEFMPFCYNGDPNNYLTDMGTGRGGQFKLKPGQWTDDTSMGLCLADSLLMNSRWDPHDLMHRFLAWWYLGYDNAFLHDDHRNSCGLGGNISLSFTEYINNPCPYTKAGDKNTSGNGSVMRNAPIPICFWQDVKTACDMAAKQSLVTHQGVEAADCCKLLTFITIKLLCCPPNSDLKTILDNVGNEFCSLVPDCVESVKHLSRSEGELKNDGSGVDRNRDWNWKKQKYQYSIERIRKNSGYIGSYAMDAMAMALHVLYYTSSFKDAVIKVVNMRGDSDSVGSVVGQMAGAFYGIRSIPEDWIRVLNQWDHGEIALRGYMLARLKTNKSYIIGGSVPPVPQPPPKRVQVRLESVSDKNGNISPTQNNYQTSPLLSHSDAPVKQSMTDDGQNRSASRETEPLFKEKKWYHRFCCCCF